MNDITIDLMDMVLSFTAAMDSVSADLKQHHTRVTNMALDIAVEMGLEGPELFDIMLASRLHDIGAISTIERQQLTELEFDTEYTHAATGYKILKDFELMKIPADIILHHHRKWNYGENKKDKNGDEVHIGSWIIHLADRIDIAMKQNEYALSQKEAVMHKLSPFFGKIFNPDVVSAFLKIADKEYFWLDIAYSDSANKYKKDFASQAKILKGEAMVDIGRVFSQIIDFRNRFTSTHSAGVSSTAVCLTRLAGYDEELQKKMRIAGYLHDLGKISVPVTILEKNGPLTYDERIVINSHTYHTYNILSHVKGLEDINRWASFHHEKLDGSGYPFHLKENELDTLSRIMMFADIFTALTEDRPYREGLGRPQVEQIITHWVNEKKLDADISDILFSNYAALDEERLATQKIAVKNYEFIVTGNQK